MNNSINLTPEQEKFISYMREATSTSEKLKSRYAICYEQTFRSNDDNNPKEFDIESFRRKHNPKATAEFLSLFGVPNGLKFLTHDFDPDSDENIDNVIKQADKHLLSDKFSYKLPTSLKQLFSGFLRGPYWLDSHGDRHILHLRSKELKTWTIRYPKFHPITSNEFGSEIQAFRDTVRVSKPKLPQILAEVISKIPNVKALRLEEEDLHKADFYTNVYILSRILHTVLFDMVQRNPRLPVKIIYERDAWNEYRLHQIKIIHFKSEANPFNDVRKKIIAQGGALFKLLKFCQGYCDWTVEANFEGETKRWRILDSRNLTEIEDMKAEETEGFTHIFTFFKYR